jgi:type III secretion protein V
VDGAEARRRRRALEREGQLYGAMDGALKFVKGDAIAGVAIVLVNLAGGLVAGALRGMDLAAAARRYALLAIGDGLVAQVPALLLAVSAGVAVTRVAAEEEGDSLGDEIGRQLLAEPGALGAVAALLAGLAVAPGLPAAPFLVLAAAAALGARRAARAGAGGRASPEAGRPRGQPAADVPEDAEGSPVALRLGDDLLALARADDGGGRFRREGLAAVRARLLAELGVPAPPIALLGGAGPGRWVLLVDEVPIASGGAPPGEVLALAAPDELALAGLEGAPDRDPLTGRPATRLPAEVAPRAAALAEVRAPLDRVLAECAGALGRAAHLLVGVQEAQALLDALEPLAPALVREASRQLPPVVLADVLRRLVEEGVSVRPLRTILEALLEAGGAARGAGALAESARRALRRHIGHRCAGDGPLAALLLDPRAEAAVRDALAGESLALDPGVAAALLDALDAEVRAAEAPPVVLASGDVRRALRGLLAPRFPRVAVLAYEELPPELPVRPVGRLALAT